MDRGVDHLTPSDGASAPKMGGSLSPLPPPPVRRHDAPCEAGRHRTALCRRRFGESLPTRFQCGFPGTTWTTTARTSPSERGALGLLKGRATSCATYARHPPSERWPPIRRHGLDPQRRKSSIISRPLEAGFSCSYWTIFSMTTSKPSWRSTVSQPASAMACRSPVVSVLAAAGSRVVQAWKTRWVSRGVVGPKRPQRLRQSGLPCNRPLEYGGSYPSKKSGAVHAESNYITRPLWKVVVFLNNGKFCGCK